jgi:hypothetical protein
MLKNTAKAVSSKLSCHNNHAEYFPFPLKNAAPIILIVALLGSPVCFFYVYTITLAAVKSDGNISFCTITTSAN